MSDPKLVLKAILALLDAPLSEDAYGCDRPDIVAFIQYHLGEDYDGFAYTDALHKLTEQAARRE